MKDELGKAFQGELNQEDFENLFLELSYSLDKRTEAREQCFKVLNEDSKNTRCRLILARLYYLDEYGEFCVRELLELKRYSSLESIDRLLESFGNFAHSFTSNISSNSKKKEEASVEKEKTDSEEGDKTAPSGAAFGGKTASSDSEASKVESDDDDDDYDFPGYEDDDSEDGEEVVAEIDFNSGFFDVLDNLDEE